MCPDVCVPPQEAVAQYGSPSPSRPDEYGDYRFALFESHRYGVRPNLLFQVRNGSPLTLTHHIIQRTEPGSVINSLQSVEVTAQSLKSIASTSQAI